jgi:nitrate/nitrite transport system permease protein
VIVLTNPPSTETQLEPQPAHLVVPHELGSARESWVRRLSAVGWAVVGLAIAVAVWAVVTSLISGLPTPVVSIHDLTHRLAHPFYKATSGDQGIGLQLGTSLVRVFTGFGAAVLVGAPLGLLMGASRRAFQAGNPIVQILRPVSPLAWFPIWLIALKNTGHAAIFVIFITALWPIVVNTAAGAGAIPEDQRNIAKVFRIRGLAYLRHVLVPNALPQMITGMRLSMGTAWMVIVAAEMLSSNSGIGYFIWNEYNAGNLPAVVSAILLIGVVGVILDVCFLAVTKRFATERATS